MYVLGSCVESSEGFLEVSIPRFLPTCLCWEDWSLGQGARGKGPGHAEEEEVSELRPQPQAFLSCPLQGGVFP